MVPLFGENVYGAVTTALASSLITQGISTTRDKTSALALTTISESARQLTGLTGKLMRHAYTLNFGSKKQRLIFAIARLIARLHKGGAKLELVNAAIRDVSAITGGLCYAEKRHTEIQATLSKALHILDIDEEEGELFFDAKSEVEDSQALIERVRNLLNDYECKDVVSVFDAPVSGPVEDVQSYLNSAISDNRLAAIGGQFLNLESIDSANEVDGVLHIIYKDGAVGEVKGATGVSLKLNRFITLSGSRLEGNLVRHTKELKVKLSNTGMEVVEGELRVRASHTKVDSGNRIEKLTLTESDNVEVKTVSGASVGLVLEKQAFVNLQW